MRSLIIGALLVLVAGACSDTSATTTIVATTPPPPAETSLPLRADETIVPSDEEVIPMPSDVSVFEPGTIDPALQPFIDIATADLAERLAVPETEVTVVSAVLVVWPDGSLGCPMPGMEYIQVLQDGSVIELEVGGAFYRYHTGGRQATPFLCDQPLKELPRTADFGGEDS